MFYIPTVITVLVCLLSDPVSPPPAHAVKEKTHFWRPVCSRTFREKDPPVCCSVCLAIIALSSCDRKLAQMTILPTAALTSTQHKAHLRHIIIFYYFVIT